MYDHYISRSKRIAMCIMGIMIFIVVLFSVLFIARETNHDCKGDDCPICACLIQCEKTIHQIGVRIVSLVAIVLPIADLFLSMCVLLFFIAYKTPVSGKIRMNN